MLNLTSISYFLPLIKVNCVVFNIASEKTCLHSLYVFFTFIFNIFYHIMTCCITTKLKEKLK